MVILDLRSLDLDDSIDLLAVTWEVSDDPSYKNILLESVEDYKNKTSIIFSENLDPDMKYYARAKALTTAGWTSWGNVDIFKVRNNTDLTPQDIFPTKVSIPRIRTFRMVTDTGLGYMDPNDIYAGTNTIIPNTNKNLTNDAIINADDPEWNTDAVINSLLHEIDPETHDLTLFEIWVDGFEVIGNATLRATSYWIEDSNGDVVWKSLVDRTNRNKIKIQDLILKADRSYRIRVVFHTDSNDVSQIATKTIVTKGSSDINLISYLDQVPFNKDIELQLEWVKDMNHIKWEVLQYSLGIVKSIWRSETTTILNSIPKGILNSNSNYLLRIKSNLSDTYKYYPFITTIAGDESPNDPLTPLLVYPTTVTVGLNKQAKILVESVAKNITYIANSEFYTFNSSSSFITGIKVGEGVLYVKAKKDNYRENIIEVKVNVVAEDNGGGTGPSNNKFLKVKPDIINLDVADEGLSIVTTNCDYITAETDSENIRVYVDEKNIRILGVQDGNYKVLVIGYDIANNSLASAMITGKITDTGAVVPPDPDPDPDPGLPPPPPEPIDYFLELEPVDLEMKAGDNRLVKVNTNAPYWDPRISDGAFFTYQKMSSTDLKISSSGTGEGYIVVVASNDDGDVAEEMVNIRSVYNSVATEIIFDSPTYTCRILNEIEIPFTSNITSTDEYEVTVENENVEVIRKLDSSFILKPKYEAANQSFNVTIVAKKNTTATHIYNETSVNITLIVPDIVYEVHEVIVFPNEPNETYNYLGGIWSENYFYPPNPVNFRIYTHREAEENNIDLVTNPYIDGTGVVISKKLGEVINQATDKFNGLRPLDFMIKTGNTDDVGNPENSNIYKVKPVVTVRGIPYERTITLRPTERTILYLSATEVVMDIFSIDDTNLVIDTNAGDYTIRTSNSNVVIPTKVKGADGRNKIQLTSGIDGTATLTIEAMNESGILVIETCTIKVGDSTSDGVLARPLPGQSGFGVSMAPLELSRKYGLEPVDPDNVNNPDHHTFGNYKDADDNIMVFIPKMYFYRDNTAETINRLGNKLQGGYYDKDKWLMRMSYTQEGGYWLHRAFINNGKEIDGIFVDKYLTTFTGTTAQELSIPRSVPTGVVNNNLGNKQVTHNGVVKTLNSTADKPLWLLIPKNRNEHTALMDIFVDYLLGDLWRVERDHHIEYGTESTFIFNNHALKQPFPLISKTANNEPYKGMIDSLGFELPATYEASPVGVEDPNIAKFTHTGYSSGIVYPLGIWQCNTGITQLYASLGDARITADNKQFWACNAFKLRFDRSSLNVENYSDPDTYDKFGIVMNSALADNSPYVVRVDGTGEGYSSLGNNTDVNSHGYLLNSLNMPEYIDDYTLITGYSNPTITDLEQNDCRPYFAIRTNIEPNNILHLDIHSTANSGFSMYGFIDIEGNPMLTENYNKNRLRRMMIVPNEGIDLNVNNTDDWIYTTTKPLDRLDYTVISPGGGIIVGTISSDGSNLEVQMKLDDQTGPEPYSLTKDIEHLKQTYPRYPIPTDTDKIEVRIEPLFTDTDLGTLELVGDSLEFTPGTDLTIDNPAKFNITYVFDTSTPDTDNLAVDYYKTTGSTTAVFSLRN
jgi:hypothetical protein